LCLWFCFYGSDGVGLREVDHQPGAGNNDRGRPLGALGP